MARKAAFSSLKVASIANKEPSCFQWDSCCSFSICFDDNISLSIDGAKLEGAISPIRILLEEASNRLEVIERCMGVNFPHTDPIEKSNASQKIIFLSLIALSKISFLANYKPINLYYLWVPYGLLQLVRNPQCDIHCDGVIRSGGSSQQTPRSPTCPPHVSV